MAQQGQVEREAKVIDFVHFGVVDGRFSVVGGHFSVVRRHFSVFRRSFSVRKEVDEGEGGDVEHMGAWH